MTPTTTTRNSISVGDRSWSTSEAPTSIRSVACRCRRRSTPPSSRIWGASAHWLPTDPRGMRTGSEMVDLSTGHAVRTAFRTDAHSAVGLDHLRRCIALAHALRAFGAESLLLLAGPSGAAREPEASPRSDAGGGPRDYRGRVHHVRVGRHRHPYRGDPSGGEPDTERPGDGGRGRARVRLGRTAGRTVVERRRWDQYVTSMARALSKAAG